MKRIFSGAMMTGAILFSAHLLEARMPAFSTSLAQSGTASWYSEKDAGVGLFTASGELFDDSQKTCASWYFKFGTQIVVTNIQNGKSVVCRVNDRGPAKRLNRILDLSKASFKSIADLDRGLIPVQILELNN